MPFQWDATIYQRSEHVFLERWERDLKSISVILFKVWYCRKNTQLGKIYHIPMFMSEIAFGLLKNISFRRSVFQLFFMNLLKVALIDQSFGNGMF